MPWLAALTFRSLGGSENQAPVKIPYRAAKKEYDEVTAPSEDAQGKAGSSQN